MFTVADRTELPRCLCPEPLTTQAGDNGFYVVFRKFIRQSRCTIPLFCIPESLPDIRITDQTELLPPIKLMATKTPCIPATAGHAQHPTLALILNSSRCFSMKTYFISGVSGGHFRQQAHSPVWRTFSAAEFCCARHKAETHKGRVGGNAYSLSKLQGFAAVFRRILFSWLLTYGC